MGDAALTMRGGEYAIHGTNRPGLDRRLRLAWLHPHVQQRYPGALRLVSIGTPVVVEQWTHHRTGEACPEPVRY